MSPRSAFRLLTSTLARPRPPGVPSRDALDPPPSLDWRPALAAGRAFLDWCRDVAQAHAAEPDDREAIERVHNFLAASLAGQRACCLPRDFLPTEVDLLITASTLIEAFGIDLGPAAALLGEVLAEAPRAVATGARVDDVLRAVVAVPRGPRVAHGLDDAPANTNARRARRAAGAR